MPAKNTKNENVENTTTEEIVVYKEIQRKTGGIYISNVYAIFITIMILALAFTTGYLANLSPKTIDAPTNAKAVNQPTKKVLSPKEQFSAIPAINTKDWVKGDINSKVVIVEYSDLQCPFCKQFHPTMQKIKAEYPDVAWVYRHFPLSFHPNAQPWAIAAECSGKLAGNDGFWRMVDAIYNTDVNAVDVNVIASQIGLNADQFSSCLTDKTISKIIDDIANGGAKAGVTGTPGSFVINVDKKEAYEIGGALPYNDVKAIVEKALAK